MPDPEAPSDTSFTPLPGEPAEGAWERHSSSFLSKTDEEKTAEETNPRESAFSRKFWLAFSMAGWVTLFYAPIVVPTLSEWLFVDADTNLFIGSDFKDYWPNTVQLIVFTVYFSTGSTVNLAWQGLIGTIMAGFNQRVMAHLFPRGGACVRVANYTGSGLRGACEEFLDPSYGKWQWFVWFDVFFFIFLVLSSNAQENTMKFSLSWHVTYMMAFMSFDGYKPSHAVTITSVIGCSLAILITLTPTCTCADRGCRGMLLYKHMCSKNLEGHPESIAKKTKEISEATVKLMLAKGYECDQYKVDKVAIQMSVKELSSTAKAMKDDWSNSWWECWVHFLTGRQNGVKEFCQVRDHCGTFSKAFEDNIGGFDDTARVMKKVAASYHVVDTTSSGELDQKIRELNTASMDLLDYISKWKSMKHIIDTSDTPAEELKSQIARRRESVEQKVGELHDECKKWKKDNAVGSTSSTSSTSSSWWPLDRHILRSNMSMFIFSILQLSMAVIDLSAQIVGKYGESNILRRKPDVVGFFWATAQGRWKDFVTTWWSDKTGFFIKAAFADHYKRGFVIRNFISIGLCFTMGNCLQGNVFQKPFNPLLAGTLAVLISHFPGSAFRKNLMRLLGLAIGNSLPIIMIAVVSLFGSLMPYAHLLAVFVFELFFGMMYYTSPEWGYVGCIVAGFGCYSFTSETWDTMSFAASYCKIGQVTAAITIKIIVDSTEPCITKKFPRTIAVDNMRKLTDESDGIAAVFRDLLTHLRGSGDEDSIDAIKAKASKLKEIVASQEALVSECEAKTTIIAGPSPPFKLDLYKGSLAAIEEMLEEIDVLCLLEEFTRNLNNPDRQLSDVRADWFDLDEEYERFYEKVLEAMEHNLKTLTEILEGHVIRPKMFDLEDKSSYTDSIRMAVVKRIMADTRDHVLTIERLCYESGCLKFERE